MTALFPLLNLALFGVVLLTNGLASTLPINGRTTGQISDSFPLVFVPAGYVFAIWGLIYLGLAAHIAYSLTSTGRSDIRVVTIRGWLAANLAANAAWILCWHYGLYLLSLALMLVILVSLKAIRGRLDAVDRGAPPATARVRARSYWLVRFPMSLYQGWISVATIANVSVVLLDAGWTGGPLSPEVWALAMIAAATALNLWLVLGRRDLAFGGVGVWALTGIAAKRAADYPNVAATASVGVLLIAIGLAVAAAWMIRPASPKTVPA